MVLKVFRELKDFKAPLEILVGYLLYILLVQIQQLLILVKEL
jgi:hypothetical protein